MIEILDSLILNRCLKILKKNEFFSLKPLQINAILSVLNFKRSIVIIGTGYGKTLIMQIAGLYLGLSGNWENKPSATIIISPLLSIVDQQILATNSAEDSGVGISLNVTNTSMTDSEISEFIKEGGKFLYMTPEKMIARSNLMQSLIKVCTHSVLFISNNFK